MAKALDAAEALAQNLMDAGCCEATARQCVRLAESGGTAAMLPLLFRHRAVLLEAVHRSQKQLDCLDYLIYKTEKEQRTEE